MTPGTAVDQHIAPQAKDPKVVFLGFAERAGLVREGQTNLFKWNLLGLKLVLLTNFFPFNLGGAQMVIGIRDMEVGAQIRLRIRTEQGNEVGSINMDLYAVADKEVSTLTEGIVSSPLAQSWHLMCIPMPAPIVLNEPGRYFIFSTKEGSKDDKIGEFGSLLVEPPPLTPERIAAIKSDPRAAKAVRVIVGCNHCQSKLLAYSALEPLPQEKVEGFTWFRDIPDRFDCECGQTRLDITSMKRNLFAMLGHRQPSDGTEIQFTRLYEEAGLDNIRVEFIKLLDADPPEEELQKFIERNPILLHQFPAEQIFFKPPIIGLFKADFAVLTPQKELVLIEIETTKTRLLKKDGGVGAPLQHAFDQVQSWLHISAEHRLAVLEALKIGREQVRLIRGVVVAGRDRGYDAEHMRRLKGIDRGQVSFLTFDDLAFGLAALAGRMGQL